MKSTGICRWLFLLISLSTWTTLTSSKEMRVVCYYTNWSVYRPGAAKFSPQNINPYLCTHLVYAFGGFTKENTLKPFDKYQDLEKGGYAKFTGLKTYNKNLKTMLAIGGWNEGSSRFSPMVANAERRKELVKNTIKFLRQNHFDGLDLDWEYPTFRDGGKPRDKDNYAQLVQELREEFDRESEKTGRPRLLLTMAVPAGIEYINKGYDVPKLTKYLDWMNILSYDYHSAFEPAVNHHAPLYSLEEDNEYNYDAELNIDYTIKHYLKLGADPGKLVLGIPTYGRSYTLYNPEAFEMGAPADGPGEMGEATRENGYLAYYEICDYVKNQGWQEEQPDPNAMGPYAYKDNQWVGYDDENIVRKKAEYVAENGLGGIMFWAIDNDDFRGNCHGRPYPLIEAAKEALMEAYGLTDANLISPPSKPIKAKPRARPRPKTTSKPKASEEEPKAPKITHRRRNRFKSKAKAKDEEERSNPVTRLKPRRKEPKKTTEAVTQASTYSSLKVTTPSYTTPAPPSTPDLDGAFKCEDEGFFPHPKDCKKYFWCLSGAGDSGIVAHQFTCPAGLYFNKAADSCDYTQNVLCNKKMQKAVTSAPPKTSSTTTTTTTSVSTTKPTPKITAATSRTTFKQSTTTEAYDDEYEYEDDEEAVEEDEESRTASEEDPKVIKELIDLIKKAGGIAELEKQLSKGSSGQTGSSQDTTTQSAISKSLYERVLSKAKTLNARKNPVPSIRNSRGPQNDGLVRAEEKSSRGKTDRGKLQYTSISRKRSSTPKPAEDEEEEDEEEEVEDVKEEKETTKSRRLFNKKSQPEYVTIRRPRVSTTTEATENSGGFNRNKILGEVSDDDEEYDEEDEDEEAVENEAPKKSFTPQYVNIRRQRPATTEESATSKYKEIRRGSTTEATPEENEEKEDTKYKILRRGSTPSPPTTVASEEISTTKYQSLRRGTTTSPVTPSSATDDSTSKYKNFRRGTASTTTTTDKPANHTDEATSKYVLLRRGTTSTTTTSAATESTVATEDKTTHNLTTPTEEENYVTPSVESSSVATTSAASEVITTVSVNPVETSLGSSSVSSTSTTSASIQDATTNANINLVDEGVTTVLPTTTKKDTSSPGTEKYTVTTKSSSDDATTAESRPSISSTEGSGTDTPTTTQRQRQRPFLTNGRPTTAKPVTQSSTTVKVSQTKFKLRARPTKTSALHKDTDSKATSSTTEIPTERNTIRHRGRGPPRTTTQNPNVDKEESEEDTTSKIKPRKRLLTTERPLEERTFRPSELDDFSSLTAVDFAQIKELTAGEAAQRRRRPTPPPTTTVAPTSEEEKKTEDETLKTSSRTLPLARKLIETSSFGKSKRVLPNISDEVNSVELDASASIKRGRGFGIRSTRQPSSTTTESIENASVESVSDTVNITPRSRRVVRRFRTTTPRTNKIEDTSSKTTSDKPPFRRGKLFATQNRNQSSDVSKTGRQSNNLQRLFGKNAGRVPFGLQKNKVEEETDDSLEDTSTEEGENIKLSESNIRENSDVNSFDTSGKQRRKLVKLVKPKSETLHEKASPGEKIKDTGKTTTEASREGTTRIIETTEAATKIDVTSRQTTTTSRGSENTTTAKEENITTLEPELTTDTENLTNPPKAKPKSKPVDPKALLRTRKIIRKVKPPAVVSSPVLDKTGRRRKIIRRRLINGTTTTEGANSIETTSTEKEILTTTQPTRPFRPRGRITTTAPTDTTTTVTTTTSTTSTTSTTVKPEKEEVSRRVFRPSLRQKSKFKFAKEASSLRPLGVSSTTTRSSVDPVKRAFLPRTNLQRNRLPSLSRRGPTRPPTTTVKVVDTTTIDQQTDNTQKDSTDYTTTEINNAESTTSSDFVLRRRSRTRPTTTEYVSTSPPEVTTTETTPQEMSTVYTVEKEEKDDNGKVKIVKSSTAIYNLYKPIADESEFDEEDTHKKNDTLKEPVDKDGRGKNYVSVFRSSTTSNTFNNFDSEFEVETPPHLKDMSDEEEDDEFADDDYDYQAHSEEVDRLIADTSTEFRREIMGASYSPLEDFPDYESIAESSSVRNRFFKPDDPDVQVTTPSKTASTSPRPKYKTFSKSSNKSIIKETIKMIHSFNETDPSGKTQEVVVNRFKYKTIERTTALPNSLEEDSAESSGENTTPMSLTTLLNMDDSSESGEESSEERTESYSSAETTENYEELTLPNSLESEFTTHLNIPDRENEIIESSTRFSQIPTEKQDSTTVVDPITLQTDNIFNQITSTTSSPIIIQSTTQNSINEIKDTAVTTSEPQETETESTDSTIQEVTTTALPKPTTPYRRRSTLRSIESRPKFTPIRRKNNSYSSQSTTEASKAFNRFRTRNRSSTENPSTLAKPLKATPATRLSYRRSTTTTKPKVEEPKLVEETEKSSTLNVITEDDLSVTKPLATTTAIPINQFIYSRSTTEKTEDDNDEKLEVTTENSEVTLNADEDSENIGDSTTVTPELSTITPDNELTEGTTEISQTQEDTIEDKETKEKMVISTTTQRSMDVKQSSTTASPNEEAGTEKDEDHTETAANEDEETKQTTKRPIRPSLNFRQRSTTTEETVTEKNEDTTETAVSEDKEIKQTTKKPIRPPLNFRQRSSTSTTTEETVTEKDDDTTETAVVKDDVKEDKETKEKLSVKKPNRPSLNFRLRTSTSSPTEQDDDTTEVNDEASEDKEIKEKPSTKKPLRPSPNFRQRLSTSRPRVVNRPLKNKTRRPNSPLRNQGRPNSPRVINKPSFGKTTESAKVNDDLTGIDAQAVKNRNKNLFSKKRKINRPVATSSTTTEASTDITELPTTLTLEETSTVSNEVTEGRITSALPVTEAVTKASTSVETTEPLTTLHHIFAAVDDKNNNTETTTEALSSVTTTTGKVEKLIEVNRIIQVKTKEAKVKNHHVVGEQSTAEVAPVVDKIGQVNRVTVIKVVDGNETSTNDVDYNDNEVKKVSPISPVYVTTEGKSTLMEVPAKVEEIPASEVMGKVNLTNITVTINSIPELLHTHRENRKFDTQNENNQLGTGSKTATIDGISHINVFTPRPIFTTETSTIALEGLFQTDSPTGHNSKFLNNEEILETENSRFVNVRVLHKDDKLSSSNAKKSSTQYVPANILDHGIDEITMKAEVVEVKAKPNTEPIRIVPIRVEMSKKIADNLPVFRVGPQNTINT